MFRAPLLSISIFAAILSQQPCRGAEIVLKLRDYADKPISGYILKETPGAGKESSKPSLETMPAPSGDWRIADGKCDPPGILFHARSYDQSYFLESIEKDKYCVVGEIVFHFREKAYASVLKGALSDQSGALKSGSSKTMDYYEATVAGLKGSNYAEAATNSLLLYDQVVKELGPKAAEPYRVLATDIVASPITGTAPLIFDPKQSKYVLSPDAVQAVTKYQKSKGLPKTGSLDWKTAISLPDSDEHLVVMTHGFSD
jgi:hypothetical protein